MAASKTLDVLPVQNRSLGDCRMVLTLGGILSLSMETEALSEAVRSIVPRFHSCSGCLVVSERRHEPWSLIITCPFDRMANVPTELGHDGWALEILSLLSIAKLFP